MRKSVRTLSTLGTKMVEYSGVESDGYVYSDTFVLQCFQLPASTSILCTLVARQVIFN